LLRKELTSGETVRKFRQTPYRLGYFGGLQYDKGVDVILEALQDIPDSWTIVVTGSGPLQKRFEVAAKEHSNRLQYLGVVDQQRLTAEMLACDAIVNPHKPISDMADGVFPFKVCEILASGALLISTALPSIDLDLSQGMLEFSGSPTSLLQAMAMAAKFYSERHDAITRLRDAVRDRFSEAAITTKLADALAAVAGDPLANHTA
jgi:glycosyltransferase involved in cell wall biosynthesis